MTKVVWLTAVLASTVTISASAQESPYYYPRGQAPSMAPSAQAVSPGSDTTTTTTTTRREWPASADAPAAGTPPRAYTVMPRARDGEIIESMGGGAIPSLPVPVIEANGIQYLTGGVGEEEEAQIKSMQNQFNLQVLMTGSQGEYLSNAMVRIMDTNGNQVLTVDGAGPYFYARLNPGTYTVEVTAPQGGIKKSTVNISAGRAARQDFRFSV